MLAHRFDADWNSTERYEALKVDIDLNEAVFLSHGVGKYQGAVGRRCGHSRGGSELGGYDTPEVSVCLPPIRYFRYGGSC